MARPGLTGWVHSLRLGRNQSHVAVVLSNFNHDTIHDPEIIDRMIRAFRAGDEANIHLKTPNGRLVSQSLGHPKIASRLRRLG